MAGRRSFGKIRKLPSGRFQASYTDPTTTKRVTAPTTFIAKRDAEAWLARVQVNYADGTLTPPKPKMAAKLSPTFAEYAPEWLTARELKPRTREEYRKLVGLSQPSPRKDARTATTLLATFGPKRLDAITQDDVRRWYRSLDPHKPTHRAHLYALLRTILGSALEEGLVTMNPCAIRAAGKAKRARKIEPATLDELAAIVESLPDQWAMLVHLSAWCALRFGEVTELRRGDVDLTRQLLKVRRGVVYVDGEAIVGTPKTEAGSRDVAIPPHLVEPLADHLAGHVQTGREALLFPSLTDSSQHLSHGTFYKHWKTARASADRTDLRLHDLRHTGAVMYAQAGATTKELMGRLGHTTPVMAMNYQHVAKGRDAELAAKLSERVTGARG